MKKVHTHYDNLKVMRDAPDEVIRAAYRTLTQKYHPDRNPGDQNAARVMVVLNKSYDVLSDPDRRRKHDAWIEKEERDGPPPGPAPDRPPPPNASTRSTSKPSPKGVQFPRSGSVPFSALANAEKLRLRSYVRGKSDGVVAVPLLWDRNHYIVFGGALAFFVWLFYVASTGPRWDISDVTLYRSLSYLAGALLSLCAYLIWRWHYSDLRPSILVTPLYLMETNYSRVWFWPLTEAEDLEVTHLHENGRYKYTSLSMNIAAMRRKFNFNNQADVYRFAHAFAQASSALNQASMRREQDYVNRHTEFSDVASTRPPWAIWNAIAPTIAAALGIPFAIGVVLGAVELNRGRPVREGSIYSTVPQARTYTPPTPRPVVLLDGSKYVRVDGMAGGGDGAKKRSDSITSAPIDYLAKRYPRSTFTKAGYLRSEEKLLATGGLSKVTVDNSDNDADVLVKLVSISGPKAFPVRVFYLPRGQRFTMNEVKAGRYDVRYLERWTGALARSEPFDIEEIEVSNGTRFSNMTMTLYKVQNGNMQTYPIGADEF